MQLVLSIPIVEIGFVFEDGRFNAVPVEWHRGMTVLDALKSASSRWCDIHFRHSDNGPSAFVTEINGQANETNGNWMYSVNGELAQEGCGKRLWRARDSVSWEYVPFDP